MECRTSPLRDNNHSLLAEYDVFFAPADLQLIDIDSAVIERATELRARYRLKTPDDSVNRRPKLTPDRRPILTL
ncbi:MAG: hypothetical protein ABSA52_07515 [Candidatus Binatia bacterium]